MKRCLMRGRGVSGALLALVGVVMAGCAAPTPIAEPPTPTEPPATTAPTEVPQPELTGDPVRGGQLYDKWWEVLAAAESPSGLAIEEAAAPAGDQPLWQTQSTNTRSGADTWRCKECHGWDYKGRDGVYGSGSHATGFPGVLDAASANSASEILAILQGGTNPDHDFSAVMSEQDLTDLALFVSGALVDDAGLVNVDKTPNGDAARGQVKYESVCINCHGPQGNAVNFDSLEEPEFVGHVAGDNPWEFIHKVRFGQPGWPMPSAIANDWTPQDIADVLAYAQTLSTEPAVSGGGPLYDKWWEALGVDPPAGDQPLWQTQSTNTRSGADTWRCKECHGWDYKGRYGVYGSGSHATGFPGVLGAASLSTAELTDWLTGKKNPDHDFSGVLGEVEIGALVAFVQNEAQDTAAFIGADGTVKGDATRGKIRYEATCAACHGLDGKKINFGNAAEPEFVGTVASDNPWEFFHKASFGQPGQPMPAGVGLGWTMEDRADVLAYAQTLPTK